MNNLLFIDIKTAGLYKPEEFNKLDPKLRELWEKKVAKDENNEKSALETYKDKAGLYPEFSQVICVSVGLYKGEEFRVENRVQFEEMTEKDVLIDLRKILDHEKIRNRTLIGFNLLGFTIPFLIKRYAIHGLALPHILQIGGLKPRELNIVDTMNVWKGTGYTGASLETIAFVMNTKYKRFIEGEDVSDMFRGKDLVGINKIVDQSINDCNANNDLYKKFKAFGL
ncbi:MAG TPA: hypothetical protein PLP73_00905 [Candidatus Absconditabacterales bacterium]|nr:hypothetical protein [Candidatus Absconditabacterales bacterium]HRU50147.1 hypothetical protein [Candidatus Absconditabacterales bacterium]